MKSKMGLVLSVVLIAGAFLYVGADVGKVTTIQGPYGPYAILDSDSTMAANSDAYIATQKATKAYVDTSCLTCGASVGEADGVWAGTSQLLYEGATKDTVETIIAATDPTVGDQTWTLPNLGANLTGAFMWSSLATNGPDIANSVTGGTNQLIFEGATANAHEAIIDAADPTADTIFRLPVAAAGTYGIMSSSLATNAVDIANSVTGGTAELVFEGANVDAHEGHLTVVEPTADNTFTLPNYSIQIGVAEVVTATNVITAAECGKTFFLSSATEFASTLPAISTVVAGCKMKFIVAAAAASANYTVLTGNSLENKIQGQITVNNTQTACADEDTITLVDGNSVGDWIEVVTDGTNWFITGEGVTAAKMTCTQAD